MEQDKVNIQNKKARFNFELIDTLVCGIQLTGTEIKSVRAGKASLAEAYCYFNEGELWIKGMNIAEYEHGNIHNHPPVHDRKLLAKRRELNKWIAKVKEKGYSIIPVRMFISQRGWAKIEIALGRGKKIYDKRESIKERDLKRAEKR